MLVRKGSSDMDTGFQSQGHDRRPRSVLAFMKYLWYNELQINCRG
jgi:hypothetical protein